MTDGDIYQYEPLWGKWFIELPVGKGSFGSVYKIHRTDMGKTYTAAVKLITVPTTEQYKDAEVSFGSDERTLTLYFEDIVKRIVNEIDMLYSLSGKTNIINYQDHEVVKRTDRLGWDILIRMEYVTSLRKYLQDHRMSREEVVRMGMDICSALSVCSTKGIVHRDIKDDNIFVNEDGIFKLGDFGIARELSKSGQAASMRGTPLYMAPEVYRGDKYDATVDIYSLGIVLYRLLNHSRMPFMPPYPNEIRFQDSEDALEKRMAGAAMPPPAMAGETLGAAVLKACAFKAEERYLSPEEMKMALEHALSQMSPEEREEPVTTPAAKPVKHEDTPAAGVGNASRQETGPQGKDGTVSILEENRTRRTAGKDDTSFTPDHTQTHADYPAAGVTPNAGSMPQGQYGTPATQPTGPRKGGSKLPIIIAASILAAGLAIALGLGFGLGLFGGDAPETGGIIENTADPETPPATTHDPSKPARVSSEDMAFSNFNDYILTRDDLEQMEMEPYTINGVQTTALEVALNEIRGYFGYSFGDAFWDEYITSKNWNRPYAFYDENNMPLTAKINCMLMSMWLNRNEPEDSTWTKPVKVKSGDAIDLNNDGIKEAISFFGGDIHVGSYQIQPQPGVKLKYFVKDEKTPFDYLYLGDFNIESGDGLELFIRATNSTEAELKDTQEVYRIGRDACQYIGHVTRVAEQDSIYINGLDKARGYQLFGASPLRVWNYEVFSYDGTGFIRQAADPMNSPFYLMPLKSMYSCGELDGASLNPGTALPAAAIGPGEYYKLHNMFTGMSIDTGAGSITTDVYRYIGTNREGTSLDPSRNLYIYKKGGEYYLWQGNAPPVKLKDAFANLWK